MTASVTPFSLKDAPALIEHLLPVQKLSAEVFKERKAGPGQTLTQLGAYWKGRKPLILNKACILGCLLPASGDLRRDLEIFELLMGMDDESITKRLESANHESDPVSSYRSLVERAKRPEELAESIHDHIWESVNAHLGTNACSFPELVEQLGTMRFGRRPRVADTFCGSGQIPFEAARLGCDVYASDLNPVACMLTWGALHIVGGSPESRAVLEKQQKEIADKVLAKIDELGIETDGDGWRVKAYLYCLETRCPQTGWMVPLIPSRILSYGKKAIAELIPDTSNKRYNIEVRSGVFAQEMTTATKGTVHTDGRGQDPYLLHILDGVEYRTKISTLRGDYRKADGSTGNKLRSWEKRDFKPRPEDIFQERLYAVHWMRRKASGKKFNYEFRSVTADDLKREQIVEDFIGKHLTDWQDKGWFPDMRIEPGEKTDEPIRTRGWTYWHHLFPPRHLLILGLIRQYSENGANLLLLSRVLDYTSKLCRWTTSGAGSGSQGEGKRTGGASDNPSNVFYNQALNTFYNYGCRGGFPLLQLLRPNLASEKIIIQHSVSCAPAADITDANDIYVTDPPYGDAVKFEEILDFFIAWLRKNPPPEFANWVWDSRRSLAIQGEGEEFRRGMVTAYARMTECMPDNGIQVIMFTHQSGSIWADMANIVWASRLQVTAAWYVVTETDSALREGSYVKGTVLLVLRKRHGMQKTTRDDLAWEIQEEVEAQVNALTGLNQEAKGLYRDENVFEDADIQMAGYAAALRVLTRYAVIDGRDMTAEAIRPRVKGETTFVDGLIAFAVDTANQCLVPQGIAKAHWDRFTGAERFYLKLIDLETKGFNALDNYQNFAKAFKVRDFRALMASQKANEARLKNAVEFGKAEMSEGSELHQSVLRAVIYAMMELVKNVDGTEVLAHLTLNVPDYYSNQTQRELVVELADYLAKKLELLRPEEASAARVLRELVKNQRLG